MPYCPKCDMEFVDGIKVCSDCGGPLVESKEKYEKMKAEQDALRMEENRRKYEELMMAQQELEKEAPKEVPASKRPARAYVKKEDRYEDVKSSASAFFLVGGVLAAASVLLWTGVIHLPVSGMSRIIFQGLMTLMAIGCLIIAFKSKKSAGKLREEADSEEKETKEIIDWFLFNYQGKDLDHEILSEDPDLSPEELSLKRFELIQDYLITGRDLPDQSYVDALCDILYAKLYDE